MTQRASLADGPPSSTGFRVEWHNRDIHWASWQALGIVLETQCLKLMRTTRCFHGSPDLQVAPSPFNPQAWLLISCTVVRLKSRLNFPS